MTSNVALGIDIGGSGIKGALVDLTAGDFATDRVRIETPEESTPAIVAAVVGEIVSRFDAQLGDGPIGLTDLQLGKTPSNTIIDNILGR